MDWQALTLSLKLAAWTAGVLLPVGILVARALAWRRFAGRRLVEAALALPLVLPLLPADLPVPLSWPQAARPNARSTAAARVDSFMCPPWLAIRKTSARNGPGLSP